MRFRFETIIYAVQNINIHKGQNFIDTGYVWAPYAPLLITPTISELNDFTPRQIVLTRYTDKEVNPDYYSVFNVDFETNDDN